MRKTRVEKLHDRICPFSVIARDRESREPKKCFNLPQVLCGVDEGVRGRVRIVAVFDRRQLLNARQIDRWSFRIRLRLKTCHRNDRAIRVGIARKITEVDACFIDAA